MLENRIFLLLLYSQEYQSTFYELSCSSAISVIGVWKKYIQVSFTFGWNRYGSGKIMPIRADPEPDLQHCINSYVSLFCLKKFIWTIWARHFIARCWFCTGRDVQYLVMDYPCWTLFESWPEYCLLHQRASCSNLPRSASPRVNLHPENEDLFQNQYLRHLII